MYFSKTGLEFLGLFITKQQNEAVLVKRRNRTFKTFV